MLETPTQTAVKPLKTRRTINPDLVPLAPTTGAELAEAWQIGASALDTCSVKVFRIIEGTKQKELVDTVPVTRYDLQAFAADYGPGVYLVAGAGRPIQTRNATIRISDDMAARCGFGKMPEPRAPMLPVAYLEKGAEIADRAVNGNGITRQDLELLIQVVRDKDRAELPKPPDPLDQMKTMASMFSAMREIQGQIVAPVEVPQTGGRTIADLLFEIVPQLLPLVPAVIGAFARPAAAPPRQVQPNARERQALPMATAPAAEPTTAAPAPEVDMPEISLTAEDHKAVGSAVLMLRPFVPVLVKMADNMKDKTAEEVAGELIQWIPTGSWAAMLHLAELVKAQGPAVLGHLIGPSLYTARWADVVGELAKIILEAFREEGGADVE